MFRGTQEGLFWLPDRPDRTVDGKLAVDDKGALELTTRGLLDPGEYEIATHNTVHGVTQEGRVTLIEALASSRSDSFGRYLTRYQETWHPYYAFQGDSYEGDLDGDIVAVEVEIQSLPEWAYEGRDLHMSWRDGAVSWPAMDQLLEPAGQWPLGEVSIRHRIYPSGTGRVGRYSAINISSTTSFVVRFSQPQSVASIEGTIGSLQALVSIAMGEAVKIERVIATVDTGSAKDNLLLHFVPVLNPIDPTHKRSQLFSMEELGGLEGVGRWLDVLHGQTHARNGLLADVYRRPVFITETTGHLLIACEAYERHMAIYTNHRSSSRKGSHMQIRKILDPALDLAGQEFLGWVGDPEGWKKKVHSVRIEQVAHLENYGTASVDAEDVYLLNRQLYTLLVARILSQCGLSEDLLDRVVSRSRSGWRTLI